MSSYLTTAAPITLSLFSIRLAHFLILLFIVFGCLFSNSAVLCLHLVFVPIVILQWQLNHGRCLLTDLENRFLESKLLENKLLENASDNQLKITEDGFVKKMLSAFGLSLSHRQVNFLMYSVMIVSLSISLIKVL